MNGLTAFKNAPLYRQSGTLGRYQLTMVARCCCEIKRYLPVSYDEFFIYWVGDHAEWWFQEEKMRSLASAFLKASQNGIPESWQKDWRDIDVELTNASRSVHGSDMAALSIEELKHEYEAMFELKKRMWAASIFIDSFDLGSDLEEIAHIRKQHNFDEHETQTLLSPRAPAYITLYHRALVDVREGKRTAEDVAHEWFWFGTDYFYCDEMAAERISHAARTASIESFVSPEQEQMAILSKYNLEDNPLRVFETLTEWRDIRKRLNFTALYGLCRILKEVLRRRNVPTDYLRWMLPHEAEALFERKLTNEELRLISARGTNRTFVFMHADLSYDFSDGDAAETDRKMLIQSGEQGEVSEIKGTVASRGKISGTVRNIKSPDAPEAAQFQKGDILVTAMTRPEFLPLMQLAGAFVTDEGGITSHAAIVAREMKKPCIIGTKIATQVLKDGDRVEVDAEKGVVAIQK